MSGHENKNFKLTYFRLQYLQKLLFRDMIITSIPYNVSKVSLYYIAPLGKKKKNKKKKKCHLIVVLL